MISTCIFAFSDKATMKRILSFLFCITSLVSFGQTMAEKVLKEARTLAAQNKEIEALAKYKQVLGFDMNSYEALWSCSLLSTRIGRREPDKEKQKALYLSARSYAEKSLKVNPNDVQSNYVMAVAMGRMALISDTKEKVAAVREVKKYADRALELAPQHAAANHIMAVWNLEVSELNWIERQVADKFFGGLPDASKDKALEYCKKAIALDPNYILYQFDLGRIYNSMGDKVNAKACYSKVGTMKAQTLDDPDYQGQAKKILDTL